MSELSELKCAACRAGAPVVSAEEIAALLPQLPGWELVDRDGVRRLERSFKLKNFAQALDLGNQIGALSEQEGHHPVLLVDQNPEPS